MAVRRAIFSKGKSSSVGLKSKILKTQQNLNQPPTFSIRKEYVPEGDHERVETLKLSHPILQVLESSKPNLKQFNQIHTQLIIFGIIQNSLVSSRVIKKLCSSPRLISHAYTVFSLLDEPDAFHCNTLIKSCVNFNKPEIGLRFYYENMFAKCISPNRYTFPLLVKICAEMSCVKQGEKTHSWILKSGFKSDLYVRNTLIHMYSSFRRIKDARKVFDDASSDHSDIVTWNSMIDGVSAALNGFDRMSKRNVVTWNIILALHVRFKSYGMCLNLFDRMIAQGTDVEPNEATLVLKRRWIKAKEGLHINLKNLGQGGSIWRSAGSRNVNLSKN
ncbi:hypothetical protein MKX01_027366 [Papaver californicum]|nr:hypothetical protein MKX01_027366 [Papaver californicum]